MRSAPSLADIEHAARSLQGRIVKTPCIELTSDRIQPSLPDNCRAVMKLELLQNAGSFKARGALLSVDALTEKQRRNGVTAISAGNHALAVAWACQRENVSAKLVMPKHADPIRMEGCEALGAELVLMDDIHAGFVEMDRIVNEEDRTAIHPFEGVQRTLGTATCGLEIMRDCPDLDALVVPIGGGGLISGIAHVAKLLKPDIEVIGVEPFGADTMYQSLQKGEPLRIDKVDTIADSLGSPLTMPYSFGIVQNTVDDIVRISDQEMIDAMALLFDALKISPEPACAASTAALIGPLKERMPNKRVGVIACGSNISGEKFAAYLAAAQHAR